MKPHQGIHFVLPIDKYIELIDGRKRQYNTFWSAFPEGKQFYQGRSPHGVKQKGTTTTVFTNENAIPWDKKYIKLQFQPVTHLSHSSQEQSLGVLKTAVPEDVLPKQLWEI